MEPVGSTSRRGARAAYHDEYPRDFGPQIADTESQVSDYSDKGQINLSLILIHDEMKIINRRII